ncbi:MAG: flippase, partial [Candidatus Paceibacteria bacterium]
MSKTREVAHNTIIQFAGKAISTALGLVAVAMMTRYLGQEMFGWYTTTMAFLQFIGVLVDFGLTPVTGQMLSEPDFDNKKVMKNILGFRLVTAGLAFGLAPLIVLFFPYPIEVKIAVSFTNISFLAISLRQVLTGFYQKKLKMYVQAIGEVLGRVVLVGGVWGLVYFGSSFLPFMVVVTLASIAYALFLFIYAWKKGFAGFSYDKEMWKSIAIKMWPLAISIMFNVIYLKGDTVLLSLFRPQSEVGIYGAAYKVIDILTESAMMMMGLLLPLITYAWSRGNMKQFRERLQKSFNLMMALGVPLVVGAIILAEEIMVLVAGGKFAASSEPLQILALAVFGVFLGATFSHTAVAMNKQKQTLWVYIS